MAELFGIAEKVQIVIPFVRTAIIAVIIFFIFNLILSHTKKTLLKRAKTRKQISNVAIFSKIMQYLFLLILVLFIFFSYAGSWTGLGLTVGLFSAALGWALQKPITGVAAWIMIVTRRPFEIGDRIIVGKVKGEVEDITLTHIHLKEIGGRVSSEESSGRVILVPNSVVFEQNIINYNSTGDYVLDEVKFTVTYDSNLKKAMDVAVDSAKSLTKKFIKATGKRPYVRTYFQPSGVNLHVRYFAPTQKLQEISSNLTQEIFTNLKKVRNVEIAYPHTEVLLRKKK